MDVAGFIVLLLLVMWIYNSQESSSSSEGATVNYNEIVYPSDINCENCGSIIEPNINTIDTSTWDLECPECGEIGFKHTKREERQEQLDWLVEETK